MSRQLLFKTLALVAALSCALGASAYDFAKNNIYYTITGTNTVKVTKKSEYGTDYFGAVVIPSTVTYNGVTYTVTAIGEYAFWSCNGMTSVKIPSTVTSIDTHGFYYCTALTNVVIPEGVEYIGDFAFYANSELTTLTIPSTVTEIGAYAFGANPKLVNVMCRATTPPAVSFSSFQRNIEGSKLWVPGGCVNAYTSDSNWSTFFSRISRMDFDFVDNGIFYKIMSNNTAYVYYEDGSSWNPCYLEESYDIPPTVTYDGVTYPVTTIAHVAFWACTNLKQITLPSSLTTIQAQAFAGCTSLATIFSQATIPPSLGSTNVFDNATYSNATLYVPEGAVSRYRTADGWRNFANIVARSYDGYLNIEGGTIHFTSEGDYPWILKQDGERTWAQSGNAGVHSSSSTLTATVTVEHSTYLYFDYITQGENGTYTLNDICYFRIDGGEVFGLTNYYSNWSVWSSTLTPGTHTLTWTYKKNASVNPEGDYFAIDNVQLYCPYNDDLNAALNVEGGNIEFYSDGDYPWITVEEGGRYYGMSGNKGVHSSESEVWASVKIDRPSILTFDFKAMGENYDGVPADVCIFMFNGSSKLYLGAYNSEWETYTQELNPGYCNMRFIFGKDVSDNGEGDYFALDNVCIKPKVTPGDVNDDGLVNITDVTLLISYLLGNESGDFILDAADVTQDGNVNMS